MGGYNGSGIFSFSYPNFITGTVINSTQMNQNFADGKSGFDLALTRDGQGVPSANLPMAGFKHTGANTGSGANSAEYVVRDYYLLQRYLDNVLLNPDGAVNVLGTTSTTDDTYGGPEAWYSLNQSNATSWAQGTNLEATTPFYQRGTQSNATPQRFGRAQIIESADCRHMRGQAVVLSARVQMSTTAVMRFAILEWTGTADSVTSDVVNDWTSSTYTAGNFFISTTTNVLAVGSVSLTAATPATITALTATVGASMTNLIVFFWTEAVAAQNVTIDHAKVSLKLGSVATPYYPRPIAEDKLKCMRLYQQSYSDGVAPATVTTAGIFAVTDPVTQGLWWVPLRTTMRVAPSLVIYSPATGASGKYRDVTSGADFDADTANIGVNSFSPSAAAAHGAANESIQLHWTASARL